MATSGAAAVAARCGRKINLPVLHLRPRTLHIWSGNRNYHAPSSTFFTPNASFALVSSRCLSQKSSNSEKVRARSTSSRRSMIPFLASSSFVAMAGVLSLNSTCTHCESDGKKDENSLQSTDHSSESEHAGNDNMKNKDSINVESDLSAKKIFKENGSYGHPNTHGDENNDGDEDEDDPSKDEETTCSICLINRQGPCRKFWVKFERCMKEHTAEKEQKDTESKARRKVEEKKKILSGSEDSFTSHSLEDEWDSFMEKSIQPESEDEYSDDERDDEGNDNIIEEEDDMTLNNEGQESSLASKCDKFMIPWIGCIQEHQNTYSLISNSFYQKDYVDPLEDSVAADHILPFLEAYSSDGSHLDARIKGRDLKFEGVEVDLGNWMEHVEANADESDEEKDNQRKETRLINAHAQFSLFEPHRSFPIEVAYIKDQNGKLLGFDSFSNRDGSVNGNNSQKESKNEGQSGLCGKCTFHIVPDETSSITAHAIYREVRESENDGGNQKEYWLYSTPSISLPGVIKEI